jgi:hypothetical protein
LRIPQGFENDYNKNDVLQLKQTIYGLNQAALAFWKELLQAFKKMGFRRSSADPCLYVKDAKNGLVIWISWVDDCLIMGHKSEVSKYHAVMNSYFDCDNIGDLKEYVGCKIDKQERGNCLLITQPVIVRSFIDEFGIQEDKKIEIPASRSDSFSPILDGDELKEEDQKGYQSGVGKLLYLSRWSRPDILNITRELSCYFMKANKAHMKVMKKLMTFCVNTKEYGILVDLDGEWNGKTDDNQQFEILGISDSDYAKDIVTRKSVSGYINLLNKSFISARSKMQECVTLSVAEAELMALIACVQEMIHVKQLIKSMKLKVKLPVKIQLDNKDAKHLVNSWSIGRRTRHVGVRLNFLRELKVNGIIEVKTLRIL